MHVVTQKHVNNGIYIYIYIYTHLKKISYYSLFKVSVWPLRKSLKTKLQVELLSVLASSHVMQYCRRNLSTTQS